MKVTIYTMTHKHFLQPEDVSLYRPLHVGRAIGEDLGYPGDDTGENISAQNGFYGELTGVYWVWKNDTDSDIIGICHYRRYFVDENSNLLRKEDYENILNDYDMIAADGRKMDKPYLQLYGEYHYVDDLLAVGRAIQKRYPDYYPVFDQVIHGKKEFYGNLMVTRRELYMEYAKWLFDVFSEAGKEIDVSTYDLYHKRVFGFLSEQLLLVWVTKNGLRVYECPVGYTSEKAETAELKLAIGQLVKQRNISQAREMFYEVLKIRPDLTQELSDIKKEIPVIEYLLYLMEQEKIHGIEGILAYSDHLPTQIAHYKKTLEILNRCAKDDFSDDQKAYLLRTGVSWVMVMVIVLNSLSGSDAAAQVLRNMKQFFIEHEKFEDAQALDQAKLP